MVFDMRLCHLDAFHFKASGEALPNRRGFLKNTLSKITWQRKGHDLKIIISMRQKEILLLFHISITISFVYQP